MTHSILAKVLLIPLKKGPRALLGHLDIFIFAGDKIVAIVHLRWVAYAFSPPHNSHAHEHALSFSLSCAKPPPPHPSPPHPSFSPPFSEKYYVLSRGKGGTGRENEGDEREPHPEAAVS